MIQVGAVDTLKREPVLERPARDVDRGAGSGGVVGATNREIAYDEMAAAQEPEMPPALIAVAAGAEGRAVSLERQVPAVRDLERAVDAVAAPSRKRQDRMVRN